MSNINIYTLYIHIYVCVYVYFVGLHVRKRNNKETTDMPTSLDVQKEQLNAAIVCTEACPLADIDMDTNTLRT